jgi:uncharacterized protein YndB with AHSA1/START domain
MTTEPSFRLLTRFALAAPPAAVYGAVRDVAAWPRWWRGCERVIELDRGDDEGLGAARRIEWKSRLPYRVAIEVKVTAIRRPAFIEAESGGDLAGSGRWTFSPLGTDGASTRVEYLWEVTARKAWMRALTPLLAPLFRLNHDWLMAAGAHGLAARLNVTAPRIEHRRLAARAESKRNARP